MQESINRLTLTEDMIGGLEQEPMPERARTVRAEDERSPLIRPIEATGSEDMVDTTGIGAAVQAEWHQAQGFYGMDAQGEDTRACKVGQWHAGATPMSSTTASARESSESQLEQTIPNLGSVVLPTMDVDSCRTSLKGSITEVGKPLLSAGEASKAYDGCVSIGGGNLVPRDGMLGWKIRDHIGWLIGKYGKVG